MAIESRWFRCPEETVIEEPATAKSVVPIIASDVDNIACFRPGESSMMFICRAFAEPEVLDGLSDEPGVNEITGAVAVTAFNESDHSGVANVSVVGSEQLNSQFRVSKGASNE